MDFTAFINIHDLPDKARKELESFYEYLIFKYKKKDTKPRAMQQGRFDGFISKSIKSDHFKMFNREERNERQSIC